MLFQAPAADAENSMTQDCNLPSSGYVSVLGDVQTAGKSNLFL